MKRIFSACIVCLAVLAAGAQAEDANTLKAVLYVGGGFHDYEKMPAYLVEKVTALANVKIDVKLKKTPEEMVAEYKDPKFGQGYDLIIYDICYGEKWEDGDYDPALRVAAAGKPAVFIHCSMHTYRAPRDLKDPRLAERTKIVDAKWHALVGM